MIDPHAPRRPEGPRRDWLVFRKRLWLGALLVGAAIVASLATEPVISLIGRDLSGGNVGVGVGVTVFNLVMFGIAQLVPPVMLSIGVAMPLVGVYQYREAMLSPRRRGQPNAGAMPVGRATAVGWAATGLLLAVGVSGIFLLNQRQAEDKGLPEPHLIYVEPPFFNPN